MAFITLIGLPHYPIKQKKKKQKRGVGSEKVAERYSPKISASVDGDAWWKEAIDFYLIIEYLTTREINKLRKYGWQGAYNTFG